MIPLSDRHALPVIVAVFLLAIPIGYHALLRPRVDDCASPARLREPDFFPSSTRDDDVPGRPPGYAVEEVQGTLLIERPWVIRPRWRLARSYDLSKLYFEPRSFSNFFPEQTVRTLVQDASGVDPPIHAVVEESEELRSFAAYLYVFAGRPVRHPLVASLRHAVQQIVGGALPLSMIVVEGGSSIEHASENEEILIEWLGSAWIEFKEACGS